MRNLGVIKLEKAFLTTQQVLKLQLIGVMVIPVIGRTFPIKMYTIKWCSTSQVNYWGVALI